MVSILRGLSHSGNKKRTPSGRNNVIRDGGGREAGQGLGVGGK